MNSLFSNAKTLKLKKVESTNSYLKKLASEKTLPEGFSVTAEYQTLGRGQYGNVWESKSGQNLLFSCLLRPTFLSATQVFYLSMSVCLAVYDVVALYAEGFAIKWPNDIIRNGCKYGGVLIENQIMGSQLQSSVIGIGLNVNQTIFSTAKAASLGGLKGFSTKEESELLQALQSQLQLRYAQLERKNFEAIKNLYLNRLYGYKKPIRLLENEQKFIGKILDVDPQGYLLVQKDNGTKKHYSFKEVRFLL
jgi:BirA family biotin operon repressor/biotin-[acetyl-CoA-carboxylase] ligase